MIQKKYYKLVKVSYEDSGYFYIKNTSNQTGTLTIGNGANLQKNLEYSTDGGNWTTADSNAPFSLTVPAGANVYMRGTNSKWSIGTSNTPNPIKMNVNHIVGGNAYSLLDKATYATRTSCIGGWDLAYLFDTNAYLISAANMNFGNITTLTNCCFYGMFRSCTSLMQSPSLPFVTLAQECYQEMFKNCTSLIVAPELPATSSLTTGVYWDMFKGCTSLNSVKCLAENISATYCTKDWLSGVSANGTFYKSANMSDWPTGNSGIPSGWTVVDA